MYIMREMSIAFIISLNPFDILAAGIGNSHLLSSFPHAQFNHWFVAPPPPVLKNIGTNLYTIGSIIVFDPLKVSRDYVDDIRGKIRSEFVVKCWESIKNKIVCILVHYIPNLADEVEKIPHFIQNIKVDCSPLRRMVTEVIEDVKKLNHLESSLSHMMSLK